MKKWTPLLTVWLLFALITPVQGQENSSRAREVYLTFQYRGIFNVYVTAYYKDDAFYLPVNELFNLLKIPHQVKQGTLTITGTYPDETPFSINFKTLTATIGGEQQRLAPENLMIREIDYFMRPVVFERLFGLHFTTSFNNLTLDLTADHTVPAVAQYEREQKRQSLDSSRPLYERSHYPLKYGRSYSTLDGAFVDYNISAIYSNSSQLYTFGNSIGAEVLAGDVQGNLFGAFSSRQQSFTTSGLRWRYVNRNSSLFSSAIVGQTSSEGITNRAITGVKISNKPIEPRLLFDRYVVDGTAPPQSEVELYLNNRLIDYQEADQAGNYRFVVPLTYGSTNYEIRIFTPSGNEIRRDSQIQIPFDYIPAGAIDYSISAGRLQDPIFGASERGYVTQARASVGLSNWLTASASTEYLSDYHTGLPSFTGTVNARLFSKYLLSLSANSKNFYRLTSSVVYSSGASWSLGYDYNPGDSRLYNIGGRDHQARLNFFLPVQLGALPLNMRWMSTYQQTGSARFVRYRADLNTRVGQMNIRLGYQDQQAGDFRFRTTGASRITNSYTYALSRSSELPEFLQGMFIRGHVAFLPGVERFEEARLQFSNELLQNGRIQLNFSRNFLLGYNAVGLNLTIDFNKIRTNSTIRSSRSDISVTQNFRGSVAFDSYGDRLLFNNRQQVGQAGAAVRLFVDNNNDGAYQDSVDAVINDPAVRISRAGGRTRVEDGVNYISQLLPYYRYDMEINRSALSNPLLVPEVENFSIITDPNQYKVIEIPFYQSGVVSGAVERVFPDSSRRPMGGLRLILESRYDTTANRSAYRETIRTFSDGSFYTYEVPPGGYRLFIDPEQLAFLDAQSQPDTLRFRIEARAEGDFVEGLQLSVLPRGFHEIPPEPKPDPAPDPQQPDTTVIDTTTKNYRIQLASFASIGEARRYARQAQQQTGLLLNILYNPQSKLYAVRTPLFTNRARAVDTIVSYYKSLNLPKAALVILQKSTPRPDDLRNNTFIQLGAFSTMQRAKTFRDQSASLLDHRLAIWYDEQRGLYSVSVPISDSTKAGRIRKLLADIRSEDRFANAFIKRPRPEQSDIARIGKDIAFKFQIQVTNAAEVDMDELASIVKSHSRSNINQSPHGLIILDNITSWSTVEELQKQLSRMMSDSPAQPIMVIIEENPEEQ